MEKGYTWDKNRNKWMVRICANNKSYYLGRYECEFEAKLIYLFAKLYKHIIFSQEAC